MIQTTRYLMNCRPDIQELRRLREQATGRLQGKMSDHMASRIELCIQEWTMNIINHATPTAQYISLDMEFNDNALVLSIRDDGGYYEAFANSMNSLPDMLNVDALDEGGMGLFILKQYFPDLEYSRAGDVNLLRLIAPCDAAA